MKPQYYFFQNTRYALSGLKTLWQTEKSFRIEIYFILPLIFLTFFLPFSYFLKLALISVLILILLTESLNSALENAVDLISPDFHPLAKRAKDCGSAAVFFSILNAALWWVLSLAHILKL